MKGFNLEKETSQTFHLQGVPLLVSSALLRSRNLGQIDLARICVDREGWIIEIGEVKSSSVGVEQMIRSQRSRLFASQHFISGIFGHRSRLKTIQSN